MAGNPEKTAGTIPCARLHLFAIIIAVGSLLYPLSVLSSPILRSALESAAATSGKFGIDLPKERYVSRDGVHGSCGQRPLGSPNSGSPGA
jgi:hypothetical protein